jgi:hypothetical protein
MINIPALRHALQHFSAATPFAHCVVDGFFAPDVAAQLAAEFPAYSDPRWFVYQNPLEDKKALNDWNAFPSLTYRVLQQLNSPDFVAALATHLGCSLGDSLQADSGLHGGGWHIHASGGNLNPHLDYSIHPKLSLQRKLNLIVYLSPDLLPEHGGHLGLWQHDSAAQAPGTLAQEIAPRFNRAVLFDTTHNAWHGMSRPLVCPPTVFRQSLAVYYLCQPEANASPRGRALYAARENQKGDAHIAELIARRADVAASAQVYRSR